MSEWQPIEELPSGSDIGQKFLVSCDGYLELRYFVMHKKQPSLDGRHTIKATHWLKIPEPPNGVKE